MNEAELKRFLELLSSSSEGEDGCELYVRLFFKLVGLFTMWGVGDAEEATAISIDVAARKIFAGTPVPDVEKYCKGIARNIARETLRRERREASAFIGFVENSPDGPTEQVARIEAILKPCFELLCSEDQELLTDYCRVLRGRARAEHRREMAARRNTTVLALRMHVTRLRKDLRDCAEKRSEDYEA